MTAFIRVIALAFLLAGSNSVWSSHPSESARDQYEAREDKLQPQLLTEATDHGPRIHMFDQIKKSTAANEESVDLEKRRVNNGRRKRSYTPWTSEISYSVPYQSLAVWRPPVYQLSRPYFIPVYGVQGRIPIYYPPQPILVNPGVPQHNPIKKPPFTGPTYLPPVEPTTTSTSTTVETSNRWGGDDFEDRPRPIWDVGGSGQQPTQRPQTTTNIIPTRATRPPGVPKTPPPLIHNPTDPERLPSPGNDNRPSFTTVAPPPLTTPPPQSARTPPSRCVWAIISCCSSSNQISYECFEQRGCRGAFWDVNPCDNEFAQAAIAAALSYYNKK